MSEDDALASASAQLRQSSRDNGQVCCQVLGCNNALPRGKIYHKRYRICAFHCALPELEVEGVVVRFCQQCGKFQPLCDFDGPRKSCRVKLQMHNAQRRRKKQLLKQGCSSNGPVDAVPSNTNNRTVPPRPKRNVNSIYNTRDTISAPIGADFDTPVPASPHKVPTHTLVQPQEEKRRLPKLPSVEMPVTHLHDDRTAHFSIKPDEDLFNGLSMQEFFRGIDGMGFGFDNNVDEMDIGVEQRSSSYLVSNVDPRAPKSQHENRNVAATVNVLPSSGISGQPPLPLMPEIAPPESSSTVFEKEVEKMSYELFSMPPSDLPESLSVALRATIASMTSGQ